MSARSIWQGNLLIQKHHVPFKLYPAVLERQVHFHLLHRRDRTRLVQHMVDAQTKRPVALDEARRAFETEPGLLVEVTKEELERTVPEASRDVEVSRFVPAHAIAPQFFDRPYFLGPAGDSPEDYFALAEALQEKKCSGIASWILRKYLYINALVVQQGYLMMIILSHVEAVIPTSELQPPPGRPFAPKEKAMAQQLIEALSGEFRPEAYRDEYEERIHELIAAKQAGKKVKPKRWQRRRQAGSLADSLEASLKGLSQSRSH